MPGVSVCLRKWASIYCILFGSRPAFLVLQAGGSRYMHVVGDVW